MKSLVAFRKRTEALARVDRLFTEGFSHQVEGRLIAGTFPLMKR